ncbi:MAG TPA: Asp-tRNA(Asn)/Glu-tRNA(Gln) amidotransferase subunit GatC [Nitrospiria bacterium]|nr:Asp-tRNA(Asn)/Glu-tRNA(Gln) amidotransferase subunit GatC [Nitrospiria bacterium]HUK56832.1 Asp-tRNA(Asn)/Glu-tRNA(Gln) amidotransferase subunit GatC [Nitrospiria bacterium]
MKLSKEEVDHVAKLARLSVNDAEKEAFSRQLSEILTYIQTLNRLDTSKIQPTSHVLDLSNVLRDDAIRESLSVAEALANAPDRVDDFFRVPKIIEERE